MTASKSLAVLAVLASLVPAALPAVQADSTRRPADRQRPLLAVGQTLFINLFVNRFDAWALREDWAINAGAQSWSRNIRLGWEWDENNFTTNLFAHPYHGSLYFNAGRANGLDYWESATLALLGSWTWEYFGESNRPSLNDFVMTSIGGFALGEMFHRVSATIRDNRAAGRARLWREIAAPAVRPHGRGEPADPRAMDRPRAQPTRARSRRVPPARARWGAHRGRLDHGQRGDAPRSHRGSALR